MVRQRFSYIVYDSMPNVWHKIILSSLTNPFYSTVTNNIGKKSSFSSAKKQTTSIMYVKSSGVIVTMKGKL